MASFVYLSCLLLTTTTIHVHYYNNNFPIIKKSLEENPTTTTVRPSYYFANNNKDSSNNKKDSNKLIHKLSNKNNKSNTTTTATIARSKPWFILHVGPQKTMSSSMQCTLQSLQSNLTIQDSYMFLGKVDLRACSSGGGGYYQEMKIDPMILSPFVDTECIESMLKIVEEYDDEENSQKGEQQDGRTTLFLSDNKLYRNVQCYREFSDLLNKYSQNRTNLIISDEKVSEIHLKWFDSQHITLPLLTKIIFPRVRQQFNIRIIVVYRRYYQWLTSLKNQGDKYSLGRRNMKQWYGPQKEPIFQQLQRWVVLTNNTNTTNNTSNNNTSSLGIPSPYTPEVYTFYQNALKKQQQQVLTAHDDHATSLDIYGNDNQDDSVVLLNMHDTVTTSMTRTASSTTLLETFLCKAIPDAYHTCQEYRTNPKFHKNGGEKNQKSNPSIVPFYDNIAYEAYHRGGLIRDLRGYRKGVDRIFVTEMISRRNEKKLHQTPYDLPLICPSRAQVQFLLDKTIQYELEYLNLISKFQPFKDGKEDLNNHRDYGDSNGTGESTTHATTKEEATTIFSQVQEEFETDYKKQKFCTVNVTEVLNDVGWKQFLLNLWHPKRGPKPIDWDRSNYTITSRNYSSVKPP